MGKDYNPKVFISYCQQSEEFSQKILDFSNRLRGEGIDTILDQYEESPTEGWPRWIENNISKADFVLMICTKEYSDRGYCNVPTGIGKGVKWEVGLIFQKLYNDDSKNSRYIPIILKESDSTHIPTPIQGSTPYNISSEKGYRDLCCKLKDIRVKNKPELGKLNSLPHKERKSFFSTSITDIDNNTQMNNLIEAVTPFDKIVNNFLKVYSAHGIPIQKIDTIIPTEFNFQMKDFADEKSISNIINRGLLEWTCSFFGVQIDWLDGTSESIYLCKNYTSLQELFNLILYIKVIEEKNVEAYLFKSGDLDSGSEKGQYLALLLRYEIKHRIYKYIPIGRRWDWGYWQSRYDLKHTIYFLEQLEFTPNGYDVNVNIINRLLSGREFPEAIINAQNIKYKWYPEDYIDLPMNLSVKNLCAKETDETQKCRDDFYERGYDKNIHMQIDKIISDERYRQCIKETVLYKFKKD